MRDVPTSIYHRKPLPDFLTLFSKFSDLSVSHNLAPAVTNADEKVSGTFRLNRFLVDRVKCLTYDEETIVGLCVSLEAVLQDFSTA